ncbi:hypothetical protein RchiOBHm_Chr6g0263551 [Rosa chinensis]|uniref:Uncharacterized protein n=1 Tax=Rosa chinensis TaxID=74649 RepID=A0A2P6PNZ8_ROSCH|nr:hypothetical protein RchiOBHm_Chr6g0263551 [Rosa chinensis]
MSPCVKKCECLYKTVRFHPSLPSNIVLKADHPKPSFIDGCWFLFLNQCFLHQIFSFLY